MISDRHFSKHLLFLYSKVPATGMGVSVKVLPEKQNCIKKFNHIKKFIARNWLAQLWGVARQV